MLEARCRAQSSLAAVLRLCEPLLIRQKPRPRFAIQDFYPASNRQIAEMLQNHLPPESELKTARHQPFLGRTSFSVFPVENNILLTDHHRSSFLSKELSFPQNRAFQRGVVE
jgi:hypothetical protein